MRVLAIARNTLREAVRDKVFGLVGAFGLFLVAGTVVLSPLTVGAQSKIVADIGLASLSLFALLVILLVGSSMVHKEIDKRTIMTILSKPVSRLEYLLGKYLGLIITLMLMMASMTVLFLVAIVATPTTFRWAYMVSVGLSVCEMVVVTAVMIFFSSFTTPLLTSLFTLAVFLTGRAMGSLEAFAIVAGNAAVERLVAFLKLVLPNLSLFDIRNAAVHDLPILAPHMLWAVAYAFLYAGVLLVASAWLFARREFP